MNIWTVAAFTNILFHGNQAGVAVVNEFPTDEMSVAIAAELKHSETAFVKKLTESEFEIRWFTPKYEVNLCGHATLATAFLLWHEGLARGNTIQFHSKSGDLWAKKEGDAITLNFPFEKTQPLSKDFSFNWEKALGGTKPKHISEAFGIFKEYLVELETPKDVMELNPDIDEINKLPGNGLIVTAKGENRYDMVSRVFAPQDGIPEDPVTVTAHSKLAHYWEERLGKREFLAYQASERGGEIKIKREGDRVFFTGNAVLVWSGWMNLPL